MKKEKLLERIKTEGFDNISDFVKANLHYLPEGKQKLFLNIENINQRDNNGKG